ncbi:MAG: 6-bladed beta-propeller [Thermodesulfobacteriota bacterium]
MMRSNRIRHFAWAVLLAAAISGCAAPSVKPDGTGTDRLQRVWPPPPADARVVYVRSVAAPGDLGMRPSFFRRVANFLTGGRDGTEPLVKPFGIALDEDGNLCVTDTGVGAVSFFDLGGNRYRRFEEIGKLRFVAPVAVVKRNGIFYVADSGLASVLAFDTQGNLRIRIQAELERPSGLAIAGEKLYVADAQAHAVAVFDMAGKFLARFGRRGVEPGEFNFPTHLSSDAKGRLYVTDSMNSRVQVFDADGRFLNVIGGMGDGSGHFSRPKGVAVDGFGNVYVADALYDNLQIFDEKGRFLLDVGRAGSEEGEFWMPAGVAIGRNNEIYVADSYNCRVQQFQYVGKP